MFRLFYATKSLARRPTVKLCIDSMYICMYADQMLNFITGSLGYMYNIPTTTLIVNIRLNYTLCLMSNIFIRIRI